MRRNAGADVRRRWLLAGGMVMLGAGAGLPLLFRKELLPTADELGRKHGIQIRAGAPQAFYVAPFTAADAQLPGVVMREALPRALPPALAGLADALAAYPPGFVAGLIKAVFIAGTMTIAGALAGGTYGPAWIIVSAADAMDDASITLTSRMGLHHELSSFVYLQPGVAARWQTLLPPDWNFAQSVDGQLGRNGDRAPDARTGFLSAYGGSSPENDFNTYAELMMTDMPALMRRAAGEPLIARKMALAFEAYAALDPRMAGIFRAKGYNL